MQCWWRPFLSWDTAPTPKRSYCRTRLPISGPYYQAKNLRLNNLQALDDVMGALEGKNEKAEAVQKRFEGNIEKYTEEKKEIQDKAHELEAELRARNTSRQPV